MQNDSLNHSINKKEEKEEKREKKEEKGEKKEEKGEKKEEEKEDKKEEKEDKKEEIEYKKEEKKLKDETLYEKLLIIGEKGAGKSSLINNLFSNNFKSIISYSYLSNITNKNNEENKTINNNTENQDNNDNKVESNKEIKDIKNNENKDEKEKQNENNNDNNDKEIKNDLESDKNITNKMNKINNFIDEQKLSIETEGEKRKNLQIFESKIYDNNIIHSLCFMCQCIIVIFDIKNMNSFEKAKKIINAIKSEIKIQKPYILLVSTNNDQVNNDEESTMIENEIIMKYKHEINQNSINNASSSSDNNSILINNYIEVSNITKKGIKELRAEILYLYEKETIILAPLTLAINQEYNKYKNNNVGNDIINNNINEINEQIVPKKKSPSTSTKSRSSKDNLNNVNLNIIKTLSPKNLFKFENDKNNDKSINNNISDLFHLQMQDKIKKTNCENIKIILLGDSLVGKTSFINRFFSKGFHSDLLSTIGMTENSKLIFYDDNYYKIKIWDTAGQERFESIPKQYYEKMEGVFLFYDITNERSFDNMIKWLKDIYKSASDSLIIYILGNKVDLIHDRKISFEMGNNFAKQKNIKFMEISCLLDLNISDVVYNMIYDILQIQSEYKNEISSIKESVSELFREENNVKRNSCC